MWRNLKKNQWSKNTGERSSLTHSSGSVQPSGCSLSVRRRTGGKCSYLSLPLSAEAPGLRQTHRATIAANVSSNAGFLFLPAILRHKSVSTGRIGSLAQSAHFIGRKKRNTPFLRIFKHGVKWKTTRDGRHNPPPWVTTEHWLLDASPRLTTLVVHPKTSSLYLSNSSNLYPPLNYPLLNNIN